MENKAENRVGNINPKCKKCGVLTVRYKRKLHIASGKVDLVYRCPKCKSMQLEGHERIEVPKINAPQCKCGYKMKHGSHEIDANHTKIRCHFKCPKCGKTENKIINIIGY